VAGAIAYEAARQLEEDGEDVPLVVLADLWLPGYLANLPKRQMGKFRQAYRWHVIKHHRTQLVAGNTTLPDVLATYSIVRRTRLIEAAARLGLIENRPYNQDDWGNRWFVPALQRAREVYRARPFRGRVVLLRSDEMILAGLGEDMGWTTILPRPPASYAVPGWHADMFQDEGARVIAEKLRPLLEEIDTEAGRTEQSTQWPRPGPVAEG
jgi:thioesterase domain-containing protein